MPKSSYLRDIELSDDLESGYKKVISRIRYNPVAISHFLDEIGSKINSLRYGWLLEHFNLADSNYNLAIVVAKAEIMAKYSIPKKKAELEADLQAKKENPKANINHKKWLGLRRAKSSYELAQQSFNKVCEAESVATGLYDKYLNLLLRLLQERKEQAKYLFLFFSAQEKCRDSLGNITATSICHEVAVINGDDILYKTLLFFNTYFTTRTQDVLALYDLLMTKYHLVLDNPVKKLNSGNTIGHIITQNPLVFSTSLKEFLKLLHKLLAKGIPADKIRLLLRTPRADVETECIEHYLQQNRLNFDTETMELYNNLSEYLSYELAEAQQRSLRVSAHVQEVQAQAPQQVVHAVCANGQPAPEFSQLQQPAFYEHDTQVTAVRAPVAHLQPHLQAVNAMLRQSRATPGQESVMFAHIQPEEEYIYQPREGERFDDTANPSFIFI